MARNVKTLPDSARALELDLDALEAPLDLEDLFGRTAPCAVEIGTGNGFFLANEAARRPEMDFIGVEHEYKFYVKMLKRCARAGLTNVRTNSIDGLELLGDWIAPGSLARVYSYFSDPWPKRRHRERRVARPDLPPLLERVLAPGGQLYFKTDVVWLFHFAVTLFRDRPGWRFQTIGRVPPPDPARGEVYSNYERHARAAGIEVWGFEIEWTGLEDDAA